MFTKTHFRIIAGVFASAFFIARIHPVRLRGYSGLRAV